MAVLDSSAIIDLISNNKLGKIIKEKYNDELLSTTSISLNEVMIGVKTNEKERIMSFFNELEVLPFDKESAIRSLELESNLAKKGRMINKLDVMIASICMHHGISLLSTDKDFKNIDGLKLILVETTYS